MHMNTTTGKMPMAGSLLRWLLPAMLLLSYAGLAQAESRKYRQLPASAWQQLDQARGVRLTGDAGLTPNVQIVCDPNCPYCARLDRRLREAHKNMPIRWVPVAYFKPDSETMAAAILSARDPVASLEANYRDYDFDARRGGHASPSERMRLDPGHAELKRAWKQWGGFTPMIIVRTRDGRILRAMGASDAFVESVLEQAAPPVRAYEAWRPSSR
ncbi:hypothetical protein [Marilutibacter alkalisoli]|uniref:Thioredoxin-like fold domain-containing protein n=1 Tax=Marilutibacter alkalisoli TaxID=2591633 RepID=A0A514BW33_9GAMM|nr:hypothetical protein [Lysobacter alkalisoli]QDH71587.1 hypothetical protein FKV23_16905 [Lysobacter alkalisoli]